MLEEKKIECTNCNREFEVKKRYVKCPHWHIYCSQHGCCDFLFKVNFKVAYQKHEFFGTIERNDCKFCISQIEDRIDELKKEFGHSINGLSSQFPIMEERIEQLISTVRAKDSGCDQFWELATLHELQMDLMKKK